MSVRTRPNLRFCKRLIQCTVKMSYCQQHSWKSTNVRIGVNYQDSWGRRRAPSNIQGATDLAGIFDILPGYLKVPNPCSDKDFKSYIERSTPKTSKAGSMEFFQLLDWGFQYLPKIDCNYGWVQIWDDTRS